MKINKKNTITLILAIVAILILIIIVKAIIPGNSKKGYTVVRENFEEIITCKGEINSAAQIEINLPEFLQNSSVLRTSSFRIMDLVEEGTYVKKGDFVAQLDQSTIMTQMRTTSEELERLQADLNNAVIDSTVKLTQLREEIIDAELDLEYNKIDLEQSVYESEAYQRKVRMNYQKAEIAINKKKRDYLLEKNKLKVGIQRLEKSIEGLNEQQKNYMEAMSVCRVTSPGEGIIMLANSPLEGRKLKRNDYTYSFMPLIAVLPNLSSANSEVLVREIDISKISIGDSVRITFDALEEVALNGEVTWIASIGEDHKDYDMKVFKVQISINGTDPGLKPAMSSNNDIIVNKLDNVLTVPVNSVYSNNGEDFVYIRKGNKISKKNVVTGPENEEKIVIQEGLDEGDLVLTELPQDETATAELF